MNEFEDTPVFTTFSEADEFWKEWSDQTTYESECEKERERIRFNYHNPPCQSCGRHVKHQEINQTIYGICSICDLSRLNHPNWKDLMGKIPIKIPRSAHKNWGL